MKTLLQSLRALLVLTLLTGVVYPLLVTGVAQLAFPKQANGSLAHEGATIVGSELLAQKFEQPRYFRPRPSAAGYATLPSGASNLGPTSAALAKNVADRRQQWGQEAPADLLTASGSGLDPHVSPEAALVQAPRVAEARGLPLERVTALIAQQTEPPQLGFLGEPRVNILTLNRALDRVK